MPSVRLWSSRSRRGCELPYASRKRRSVDERSRIQGALVRAEGLEPPRPRPPEPKSGVSTNSTTPASRNAHGRRRNEVRGAYAAPLGSGSPDPEARHTTISSCFARQVSGATYICRAPRRSIPHSGGYGEDAAGRRDPPFGAHVTGGIRPPHELHARHSEPILRPAPTSS